MNPTSPYAIQTSQTSRAQNSMSQRFQDGMDRTTQKVEALRKQIRETEELLARLKKDLVAVEKEATGEEENEASGVKWPLKREEYKRYGRQMIVPSVGLKGIYFLSYLPFFHILLLGVVSFGFRSVV